MRRWIGAAGALLLWVPSPARAAAKPGSAMTPLESFIESAERIKKMRGGRVSAVFWNLANATELDFQALGTAGFNEVISDGHHFGEGHLPLEQVANQVAAASRAGITSFKFVRGSPDWAGAKREDAKKKTAALAERILQLKEVLKSRGDREAAEILRGIVVNVEPYAQKGWNYDLSGYVGLHEELERLVEARGLTYETFDAFWIGEPVHESGNEMTGYRVTPGRTSYVMSYRRDGTDAFKAADFFATKVPHVAGFDLVSDGNVGFKENPEELGQAVTDYVNLSLATPGRKEFRGIFVNASRVGDLVAFIRRGSRA